ncbi:MAG: hypothetical protein LBT00_07905 [Spirochaetaceae bacterium]|nr:hypothetical protein [Spirochaetaceae bacterium]
MDALLSTPRPEARSRTRRAVGGMRSLDCFVASRLAMTGVPRNDAGTIVIAGHVAGIVIARA